MLNIFIGAVLSMGIYFYIIPIILGFFIFHDHNNLKRDKNINFIGFFGILIFVIAEYFSKTDIHFVSDIIISLETTNLQFQEETFIPLIFITSIISMIFWIPSFIAIALALVLSLAFPKMYIDLGFFIFIIGSALQTIHLIKESNERDYYLTSPPLPYQEYLISFFALVSIILKILKIIL